MRELVHAINTHVEMVDLEVTSNLNVAKDVQAQQLLVDQPTEDAPKRQAKEAVQLPPTNPSI